VRLLLDAHVPGPNVGRRLEQNGDDVRALDHEPALEGLDDDEVSRSPRASSGSSSPTTSPTSRGSCATGPPRNAHAGVILVCGIDHSEFALIARGIEHWLRLRPDQAEWTDFPAILDRRFARR